MMKVRRRMMQVGMLFGLSMFLAVVVQAQSLEEFMEQAKKGNRDAQYEIGMAYYTGELPQSEQTALHWFYQAAQNGHTNAQLFLGMNYYRKGRTPADSIQAYIWLTLAAKKNQPEIARLRKVLMQHMSVQDLDTAKKQLAHFYQRSNSPEAWAQNQFHVSTIKGKLL